MSDDFSIDPSALRGVLASKFKKHAAELEESRKGNAERTFKAKVIKQILNSSIDCSELFDKSLIDHVCENEEEPDAYLRDAFPGTIFEGLAISHEILTHLMWFSSAARRTNVWRLFIAGPYSTVAFKMAGAGVWIITREATRQEPGSARIFIPASGQHDDAVVMSLAQFMKEYENLR